MKAIILAAGIGTRLGNLTNDTPKCLIPIDGKSTILEKQVEILKKAGIKSKDIIVVVGQEGDCWNDESYKQINKIVDNVVINKENLTTKNTHSLLLASDDINPEEENIDLLVLDGDTVFCFEIISNLVNEKRSCVISKKSFNKKEKRNKILYDQKDKMIDIGKDIPYDKLKFPYSVFGAILRIQAKDYKMFKEALLKEKEYSLDKVVKALCNMIDLYKIDDERWVNINNEKELEEARKLFLKTNTIIMMAGYTATGKSIVAKKLSQDLGTDIYHSAVTRKKLGLMPEKGKVDEFFDFRTGKRHEVDKKVYGELAKLAEKSIKKGKEVIVDAGNFFKWQRDNIYSIAQDNKAEVYIVRITCKDENEIRRRLEKRHQEFGKDPLNEAPSWKTYESTKLVTEPHEDDDPACGKPGIIEYDTLTKEINVIQSNQGKNIQRIVDSLRKISNFVIAIDFDGVISNPYPRKVEILKEHMLNITDEQSGYETAVKKLKIDKEAYNKAVRESYTQSNEKLPLVKDFLVYYKDLQKLPNTKLFVITGRPDDMLDHLKDYLKYHKVEVDGIINANTQSKFKALSDINAAIFVDDQPFKINQVLEEMSKHSKHFDCRLILLRTPYNSMEPKLKSGITQTKNWKDLYKLIHAQYKRFFNKG